MRETQDLRAQVERYSTSFDEIEGLLLELEGLQWKDSEEGSTLISRALAALYSADQ